MATSMSSATQTMREMVVQAQPLTEERFARYGRVIAMDRAPLEMKEGRFTANLVELREAPEVVGGINRHMDHTQLFVPLNGAPTLVVVAPREVPEEGFDPEQIEAFVADGSFAYTFDAGTWHIEPRAIDPHNNRVINIQSDVYRNYTELVRLEERCGVRLAVRTR